MGHPCLRCGTEFPHTAEHFHVHKRDGLTGICHDCHKADVRHNNEKIISKRKKALGKIEDSAIDLYRKLASAGGSNIPHSAELVEKVCEYFGGVSGLAAIMVKQYYDSKPGSSTRNKMLETVTRLIQHNVDNGGSKKPLTLWTEEELEQELQDRFRLAILSQKRIVDGKEAPENPAAAQDSDDLVDDPASGGPDQGTPMGIEGTAVGGVEPLPADAGPDSDPCLPVE
jgi:hypothetical protein